MAGVPLLQFEDVVTFSMSTVTYAGTRAALPAIFDLLPLCSMASGKPPPSASAFLQNLETAIISSVMHITIARKILLL